MADATDQLENDGISQEEQAELASEIEALFTQRSELPEQTETRRKHGSTLPLLVNFAAVVVLAIGIYFVLDTGRQLNIAQDARSLQATESTLVETVIAESSAEIAERDAEILRIQDELSRLANLRAASSDADSGVDAPTERELELRAQLEELLAVTPAPSAVSQLDELNDLRSRQSFVLTQLRSLYQDLSAAVGSADSARLTSSIAAIQALLDSPALVQAGLGEMVATLSLGNDAILVAVERTAAAPDASEAELLLTQIQTLATQASARLEAGETDAAERLFTAVLDAMDETATAHQALLARQRVEFDAERAQIDAELAALRRDLNVARRDLAAARQTIAARDTSIESLQQNVLRLDANVTARESTIATLEGTVDDQSATINENEETIAQQVTTIATRDRTIRDLRDSIARRDLDAAGLDSRVAELQSEIDEEQAAVASLQATLANRDTRITGLEAESTRLKEYESRLDEFQTRLEQLSSQVDSDLRRAEGAATSSVSESPSQSSVVNLLETKVQLREVVDSTAVRTEYPSLYNDMELYFDAFGEEKEESGRRAAYLAASASLEELIRSIDPGSSVSVTGASLEGYLTRLENLLSQMLNELE